MCPPLGTVGPCRSTPLTLLMAWQPSRGRWLLTAGPGRRLLEPRVALRVQAVRGAGPSGAPGLGGWTGQNHFSCPCSRACRAPRARGLGMEGPRGAWGCSRTEERPRLLAASRERPCRGARWCVRSVCDVLGWLLRRGPNPFCVRVCPSVGRPGGDTQPNRATCCRSFLPASKVFETLEPYIQESLKHSQPQFWTKTSIT